MVRMLGNVPRDLKFGEIFFEQVQQWKVDITSWTGFICRDWGQWRDSENSIINFGLVKKDTTLWGWLLR
jgi:hypothetical protein